MRHLQRLYEVERKHHIFSRWFPSGMARVWLYSSQLLNFQSVTSCIHHGLANLPRIVHIHQPLQSKGSHKLTVGLCHLRSTDYTGADLQSLEKPRLAKPRKGAGGRPNRAICNFNWSEQTYGDSCYLLQ